MPQSCVNTECKPVSMLVRDPYFRISKKLDLGFLSLSWFWQFLAELPKNAKCLMDCEAAVILQGIEEQLAILSRDPAIKIPE